MAVPSVHGQAYNRTRQISLAIKLSVADTHWTRLRGLLGRAPNHFGNGSGLWIVPCHGVHTLGMGFPIDVLYLDREMSVIHVHPGLQPWRFSPIRRKATSILELPMHTLAQTKTVIGDKIEITLPPKGKLSA